MIYRLIILTGERRGERITLSDSPITLGRGETCDVQLKDPEMAATHAVVSVKEDDAFISDLGSMNRILVNNREIRESHLKHGDVIEVGQTRFLVQAYVQAEVQGVAEEKKHSGPGVIILSAVAVIAVCVVLYMVIRHKPTHKAGHDVDPNQNTAISVIEPLPIPPVDSAIQTNTPVGDGEVVSNMTPDVTVTQQPPPALSQDKPPQKGGLTPPAAIDGEGPPSETVGGASDTNKVNVPVLGPAPTTNEVTNAVVVEPKTPEQAPKSAPLSTNDVQAAADKMMLAQADTKLAEAKALVGRGSLTDADEKLMAIQQFMPTYVPAYSERAVLFEQRGLLDPAIIEWGEVIRMGPNTADAKRARSAVARLDHGHHELMPPYSTWIRLVSADISKFPESQEAREMRMLSVRLALGRPTTEIDPTAVAVLVQFYDRDTVTGVISPSSAKAPTGPLSVTGLWLLGEVKTVNAAYVVPIEARADRRAHYFGYKASVYYQGALQGTTVEPSDLQSRLDAGASGAASK